MESIRGFRILLLGPFAAYRDDEPLPTARWSRPALALLKLLAIAPEHRRSRDEVMEALWPDAPPEAAASNLRSALHALRRELGGGDPTPILYQRGWLVLNPTYTWEIDIERFEELQDGTTHGAEDLDAAVRLYRGEPLVEDRYEDWAAPVREHFRTLWRSSRLRLASHEAQNGSSQRAVDALESLLTDDPLDEDALRHLLRLLARLGRRAEARRRYTRFVERLRDDMDLEPEHETVRLVEEISTGVPESAETQAGANQNGAPAPYTPTGGFLGAYPDGPMVARETELERIQQTIEVVQEGGGRFVLVAGERGAGKTRLAQEIWLELRRRGIPTLTGRCYARETTTILYPFREILPQLLPRSERDNRGALPVLSTVFASGDSDITRQRHAILDAVTATVAGRAAAGPIGVLLDDLQWADSFSLDLVGDLARHTRGRRVFLLGTYCDVGVDRESGFGALVRELDREGLVEHVPLRRLSVEGTAAMLSTAVIETESADDFVQFVHRRTKGNPYFIRKITESLGGRYALVRQIGVGGMGRVFEAIDTRTGERVAAKLMFARTEADAEALRRFQQEGTILASLQHPNIVNIRETFLEEYAGCIVMDLVEGRSLRAILDTERPDLERVRAMALQVTAALAHAHEHGIVHRDIKPDNILITDQGEAKVADFGIARLLRPHDVANSTLTSTGLTLGTPLYMAPEQVEGGKIDGRTDIYSTGAVLYQALTGRPPFDDEDPLTLALRHVRDMPEAPSSHNAEVPPAWDQLVLRCLTKQREDRYPTATALHSAIKDLPVAPSSPSSRTHTPHDASRDQSVAVADQSSTSGAEHDETSARAGHVHAALPRWMPGPRTALALLSAALVCAVLVRLLVTLLPASVERPATVAPSRPLPRGLVPKSFKSPSAITVDPFGNIYVLDRIGCFVEKFSPAGVPLAIWGRPGRSRGEFRSPRGLTVDGKGNVYVADTGNDRVQEFSPSGASLGVWGHRGVTPGSFFLPLAIGIDGTGRVYVYDQAIFGRVQVFTRFGDHLTPIAQVLTSSESGIGMAVNRQGDVYVTRGNGVDDYSRLGRSGRFGAHFASHISMGAGYAGGMAVHGSNGLLVTDLVRDRFIFSDATTLHAWGSKGSGSREFRDPRGVATDSAGNIYVADTGNRRIQKITPYGDVLAIWGSKGTRPAPRLPGGASLVPDFSCPNAVDVDAEQNLYVATLGCGRQKSYIEKISPSGQLLAQRSVVQEAGNAIGLDGSGYNSQIPETPYGLAIAPDGHVYLSDAADQQIVVLSPALSPIRRWSSGQDSEPLGLAIDRDGNVRVADSANDLVRTFSPQGKALGSFGGNGSEPGRFNGPYALTVDTAGHLYTTEARSSARIQKFSAQGKTLAAWGSMGSRLGDVSSPYGIAWSPKGLLYIADADNNRILVWTNDGKPLHQWTDLQGPLSSPAGVTVGKDGDVYIADFGNNRVLKVSPQGKVLRVWY